MKGDLTKRVFAEGKYKPALLIWDRLRYLDIEFDWDRMGEQLFTYNTIILDSESFLHKPENLECDFPFETESQTILEIHRTCAISVCTNVEGVVYGKRSSGPACARA